MSFANCAGSCVGSCVGCCFGSCLGSCSESCVGSYFGSFFAIWELGGREYAQNTSGGSGSISGYRGIDSENLYFSTYFSNYEFVAPEGECISGK